MVTVFRRLGLIVLLFAILVIFNCGDADITDHNFPVPPTEPSNPSPANGANGIDTSLTLIWQCSDGNGDTLTYDIYLDTLSEPVIIDSNLIASNYAASGLEVSRDYYWKVVARDDGGLETSSPVWHFSTVPGAELIAFVSTRNTGHQMFAMNPDGSNVHILSNEMDTSDFNPVFFHDGSKIIYNHEGHIFAVNHDGDERYQIAQWGQLPVWSPDGSQIAYIADGGNEVFHSAIWVVGVNGENLRRITGNIISNWESEKISWSMADQIVFPSDSAGAAGSAIYAINPDGTDLRQIINHDYYDFDPVFSHDGTRIAFARYVTESDFIQIFVMNSDGSDQHNIQNSDSYGMMPCWSPDDSQIAYTSFIRAENNDEIYVMNADGSNQHNITNNPAADYCPTWGPYHR
jgi:Tol biopolymer transport system component